MIEKEFYGTMFRICDEGKVYRQSITKIKKWKRIDNNKPNSKGYIQVTFKKNGKVKKFQLHRIVYHLYHPSWNIMNTSKNNSIDHIDGIPSNNHIDNLRVVTHQENHFNKTKAKGYYLHKPTGKWLAHIKLNGKLKYLGYFEHEEDARQAYVEAKLIYHVIQDRSSHKSPRE